MMATMYGELLRRLFPSSTPGEPTSICWRPTRAPDCRVGAQAELAAVLHAHPALRTHLEMRTRPSGHSWPTCSSATGPTGGALDAAEERLPWGAAGTSTPAS